MYNHNVDEVLLPTIEQKNIYFMFPLQVNIMTSYATRISFFFYKINKYCKNYQVL